MLEFLSIILGIALAIAVIFALFFVMILMGKLMWNMLDFVCNNSWSQIAIRLLTPFIVLAAVAKEIFKLISRKEAK